MATFVTVQPIEGEAGVTAVAVTAPEYTGRKQRTDTVTFTTSSNKSATVTVTQAGKEVFFATTGYDGSVYVGYRIISANGGNGYIEISTNSRQFYIGFYAGAYTGVEPTITGATVVGPSAGGASVVAGGPSGDYGRYYTWKTITPTGDPGADGLYRIRIYMTFAANNTQSAKTLSLKIYDADDYSHGWSEGASQAAPITISQSALSPTAEGDSTQVTVTSQEHWDASVND